MQTTVRPTDGATPRINAWARRIASNKVTATLVNAGLVAPYNKAAFARALLKEEAREGDMYELASKLVSRGLLPVPDSVDILDCFDGHFFAARAAIAKAEGGAQ